jgi:hypothetical protein
MVNYCFVIPILEGLVELVREFSQENSHTTEHDEFYQIAGVSGEQAWIQLSPTISGMPDFEVISMETKDPAHMFKEFGTSSHPYAVKFREFAKKDYGIDFTGQLPPLNENIVDWEHEK